MKIRSDLIVMILVFFVCAVSAPVRYLRKSMGYQGVIVTDSLSMAEVRKFTGSEGKSAIRAVLAGDDLLCTENYKETYRALYHAFRMRRISKKE